MVYNLYFCKVTKNLKARLVWSNTHEMCDTFNWNKIVVSNETKTELLSNNREFVRRPKGKGNDLRYITNTVKFVGQTIMHWGYIKKIIVFNNIWLTKM